MSTPRLQVPPSRLLVGQLIRDTAFPKAARYKLAVEMSRRR